MNTFKYYLFLLSLIVLLSCENEKKDSKPNVIVFLIDDLGSTQIGNYGSKFYNTPNIDLLAKEGMRFTRAYASSPLGAPNTASILTGKYPVRNNLTNGLNVKKPIIRKLLEPKTNQWLDTTETTFVKLLNDDEYKPVTWDTGNLKGVHPELMQTRSILGFNFQEITQKGIDTPPNDKHLVGSLTEKSIDFIRKNRENPFLLFISHHSVHTPLAEEEALIANYYENPLSQNSENNPVLAAMIERLDNGIGDIIKELKKQKLSENTIIIFCSDNGGNEKVASLKNLKGGKGNLYEGGIRIPLIISWPGKVKSGLVNTPRSRQLISCPPFWHLLKPSQIILM